MNLNDTPFTKLDSNVISLILQDWLIVEDIINFDIATLGQIVGKSTYFISFWRKQKKGKDTQPYASLQEIVSCNEWIEIKKCLPRAVDLSFQEYEDESFTRDRLKFLAIKFTGLNLCASPAFTFVNSFVQEAYLDGASPNEHNLAVLGNYCPHIKQLCLSFVNESTSEELLSTISTSFPQLSCLELRLDDSCAVIDGQILFAQSFPMLKRLIVNNQGYVSPSLRESLFNMKKSCIDVNLPGLKWLEAPFYLVCQLMRLLRNPIPMEELIVLDDKTRLINLIDNHLTERFESFCFMLRHLQKVDWRTRSKASFTSLLFFGYPLSDIVAHNPPHSLLRWWSNLRSEQKSLHRLTLHFNDIGTIQLKNLSMLQRRFNNLRKLSISGNVTFDLGGCAFAMLYFPQLTELEFHCQNITNASSPSGMTLQTKDYVADLVRMKMLKLLTLIGLKLDTMDIHELMTGLPLLKRLSITNGKNGYNEQLIDYAFNLIINSCPHIVELKLQVWPSITLEAIIHFLEQAKDLMEFEIVGGDESFCKMSTQALIYILRQQGKQAKFKLIPKFVRLER